MQDFLNEQKHLLSLKVIRQSNPLSIVNKEKNDNDNNNNTSTDSLDPLNNNTSSSIAESKVRTKDLDFFETELLPSTSSKPLDNIYLGATFNSHFIISNDSFQYARDISIKVELQTNSQRLLLIDTSTGPVSLLDPKKSCEFIIKHEIKELGIHNLTCLITYSTIEGERRLFTKFYKFQVLNPFAVKTKVNSVADGTIFLEVLIQNVSKRNIIFGDGSYLNPQDIRQYLYMLTPKPTIDDKTARSTTALGKLDIVWRSNLGETGRLQTSQLARKPPLLDEIELSVISIPSIIELEIPFKLGCRLRNRTSSTLSVIISSIKNKTESVLISGISTIQLGELSPDAYIDFNMEFIPLSPGLQKITGIKITDIISNYTKEIDHFTDIFVLFSK
ncbi:14680_t:CDS:2 [Entrophospora sp. SA101]|nr:12186_t:CDS:2 [Entrophospora sp. SA101]CAJ0744951.1 12038_t:CDS:2 [Entrophospora sp. SA101]CAJ0750946.1 14680_t:CDS:2 [Entrophospora sp. SA101]CAJ0841637.1 15639_t:CDS:2 [Entrophospora sp. SA101]